jgi:redox-sensitive bicupin YhaK (pirin superfamily)
LIGGPPLPERRYLDWNFCSTSKETIAAAKELYRRGELGEIPGDGQNLPLPEDVG